MREVMPLHDRFAELAETGRVEARALRDQLRGWADTLERLSTRLDARLDENAATQRVDAMALRGRLDAIAPPFPSLPRLDSNGSAAWFHSNVEGAFRGSPDDIRKRLAVYLPHVRALQDRPAQALDLGCGRGEWLDLLQGEGIVATGVDENEVSANRCIERGLQVVCADALMYMRGLADGTLSIVSAFHVVEHLATETLVAWLLEARRLLRSGGLLILETPNAENVVVGATTFHLDPTHRRPIPAELLRVIVGFAGFDVVEIVRLQADAALQEVAANEHWPPTLRNLLGGPRDIGLVAKPRAVEPTPA
jgi:O-antigen chain-terminating methyltransferase